MKKKLQRGTIYKTDGQAILVKPKNGKEFSLEELQLAVGGYIEGVRPLDKRSNLYVNEEGLLKNLPPNGHTQAIVDMKAYDNFMYPGGIVLRGNAISTYRVVPGEEGDLGRMLVEEAVNGKS
jgi:hypothetical protein